MRFLLGVLVALAIGWGCCAPTDAQELFPLQAVSGGGGGGCLPGSFCPQGFGNWVNDLDEEFTGSSLPSGWFTYPDGTNTGGEQFCGKPGAMVFNHPGVTLFGLPYDFTNGAVTGCSILSGPSDSSVGFSSPGYFEANVILDSSGAAWDGPFFEFGVNGGCKGDIAQNGSEVDLVETLVGGFGLIWDGYTTCTVFDQPHIGDGVAGAHHVWGVDFGDNNQITFYIDGVLTWSPGPFSDGVEPGTCPTGAIRCSNGNWEGQFIFQNFMCLQDACTNNDSTGMKIIWARHYHH